MDARSRRVVRAALTGWAGMTGLITVARLPNINWTDIIAIEGAFFAAPNSKRAYVLGSVVHLGVCLWIAFANLLGFNISGLRPSWKTGALGGLFHWLIASLVASFVTAKHPRRARLQMPGFAGLALGARGTIGWLVSHVLFGILLGWQYGRDNHVSVKE